MGSESLSEPYIYNSDIRLIRWLHRLMEENPWPVHVRLDLSDRCNCACPTCAFERKEQDIPLQFAQDILFDLHGMLSNPARAVTITGGGEPLLHPQWKQLLQYISHDFLVGLLTNGLCATSTDDWDCLARTCDWIRVSINAGVSSRYAERHGVDPAMYEIALQTVRELASRTVQAGYRLRFLSVGCLVMPDMDLNEMMQATNAAYQAGAQAIMFRPLWAKGPAVDFSAQAKQIRQMCPQGFAVLWPKMRVNRKYAHIWESVSFCAGARLATSITADGRVWVCGQLRYKEDYLLGDLREQTFAEIWHSERRASILEGLPDEGCLRPCCYTPLNHQAGMLMDAIKKAHPHIHFI